MHASTYDPYLPGCVENVFSVIEPTVSTKIGEPDYHIYDYYFAVMGRCSK